MEKVIDSIYHREWDAGNTNACAHPAVVQRYGVNGVCIIPVFKCMQCRYAVHFPMHGGIHCGYRKEE